MKVQRYVVTTKQLMECLRMREDDVLIKIERDKETLDIVLTVSGSECAEVLDHGCLLNRNLFQPEL